MEVEIAKETSEELKEASKLLGINQKELVDRAIVTYIDSIKKILELKRDLTAWDLLSDEAIVNFEKSL